MTEFNAGEEFFYYGNDKSKHGNLGKVRKIHSYNPTEYACIVEGLGGYLYLTARRMQKIDREPDWEI